MASNYSYGELMTMQEDAIRRVREMQKRATIAKDTANESINLNPQSNQDSDLNNFNNFNNFYNNQAPNRPPEQSHVKPPESSQVRHTINNTPHNNTEPQNIGQNHNNTQNQNRQNVRQRNNHNFNRNNNNEKENEHQNENSNENKQNSNYNRNFNQNGNPFYNLFNDTGLSSLFGNNGLGNLSGILGNNGLNLNAILEKIKDPDKGEQILLLGVLILLSNEEADRVLLLAILYIMLD